MKNAAQTRTTLLPSATPTEEEIALWQSLSRQDQVARLRSLFVSAQTSGVSPHAVDDLIKQARNKANERG